MRKLPQDNVFLLSKNGAEIASLNHPDIPYYTTREVLEQRHYQDYTPEARRVIDLITLHSRVQPIGSSKYKVHEYLTDIDLMEAVRGISINAVRLPMTENIQRIVRNLEREEVYFSRFQCGCDRRYNIYLGEVRNGRVLDYNNVIILRDLKNLFSQDLLTKEEYKEALSFVKLKPSEKDYYLLYCFLRQYLVLEWNEEEILVGYKQLRAGKKLYLDEALIDKSLVKLDIWASIPYPDLPEKERFVEVTNWFVTEVERENKIHTLSISQEETIQSLEADVYDCLDNEPMKAAKKYWNYLLELEPTKDVVKELKKLAPLFSSYISFLDSVACDIQLQLKMYSLELLSRTYIDKFSDDTLLRLKDYHPDLYFDEEVNEEALLLDHDKMFVSVQRMTRRYLRDQRIDMLEFLRRE